MPYNRNWVMVAEKGICDEAQIKEWLQKSKRFVESLPPK